MIGVSVSATFWFGVRRGQDFNWDQQNYHISGPLLLAHGTFWSSIAPSGIQSYFNPYVAQIEFTAMHALGSFGFAVALCLVQSVAFMLAGLICADIGYAAPGYRGMLLGLLGFMLCVLAPVSLAESGTTFIDLVTAVPVLAAYAILLRRGRPLGLQLSGALAGLLLGAATALKLTNGIFVAGLLGFALAGSEPVGRRVRWVPISGLASIVGFLLIGGQWHLELWERFGNPFFPYYNNIFHSADFSPTALRDTVFLPRSAWDIWRYPAYWFFGGSPNALLPTPSCEQPFRDPRWLGAIIGATLLGAALAMFPQWRRRQLIQPATGLLLALLIDYLAWLAQFGIHRYLVPVDILCGAMLLVLATRLVSFRISSSVLLGLIVLSGTLMQVPSWGHLPWSMPWPATNAQSISLGANAVVFLSVKPSTIIATRLPATTRYVGIYPSDIPADGEFGGFDMRASHDTSLTRQLKGVLTETPLAPLAEVDLGTVSHAAMAILASYHLSVTNQCRFTTLGYEAFRLCEVARTPQ